MPGQSRQAIVDPLFCMGNLLCPGAELLAHADRHRIHEVRAACLHDFIRLPGLLENDIPQVLQGWKKCL